MTAQDDRVARHRGLVADVLRRHTILCIGAGGIAGAIFDIAGMNVSKIIIIDPGMVEPQNVGTSGFAAGDIGVHKVAALARHINAINPDCRVEHFPARDADLPEPTQDRIWREATIVWSMTDDIACHIRCNQLAFRYQKDTLFGAVHGDNRAWDLIGSLFPEAHQGSGCYYCHARRRIEAHEKGRKQPEFFPSHRLSASAINLAINWVTVGLAHYRAGSDLWIARYGEEFARRPCLLGLLDLEFWTDEKAPFAEVPFSSRMFATRLLDRPEHASSICPFCKRH